MTNLTKSILKIDLLIQAVFWFALAAYHAGQTSLAASSDKVMMGLLVINAILFLVFCVLLTKRRLAVDILLLLFILANAVLTLTDQVGLADILILVLNLIALACHIRLLAAKRTQS